MSKVPLLIIQWMKSGNCRNLLWRWKRSWKSWRV